MSLGNFAKFGGAVYHPLIELSFNLFDVSIPSTLNHLRTMKVYPHPYLLWIKVPFILRVIGVAFGVSFILMMVAISARFWTPNAEVCLALKFYGNSLSKPVPYFFISSTHAPDFMKVYQPARQLQQHYQWDLIEVIVENRSSETEPHNLFTTLVNHSTGTSHSTYFREAKFFGAFWHDTVKTTLIQIIADADSIYLYFYDSTADTLTHQKISNRFHRGAYNTYLVLPSPNKNWLMFCDYECFGIYINPDNSLKLTPEFTTQLGLVPTWCDYKLCLIHPGYHGTKLYLQDIEGNQIGRNNPYDISPNTKYVSYSIYNDTYVFNPSFRFHHTWLFQKIDDTLFASDFITLDVLNFRWLKDGSGILYVNTEQELWLYDFDRDEQKLISPHLVYTYHEQEIGLTQYFDWLEGYYFLQDIPNPDRYRASRDDGSIGYQLMEYNPQTQTLDPVPDGQLTDDHNQLYFYDSLLGRILTWNSTTNTTHYIVHDPKTGAQLMHYSNDQWAIKSKIANSNMDTPHRYYEIVLWFNDQNEFTVYWYNHQRKYIESTQPFQWTLLESALDNPINGVVSPDKRKFMLLTSSESYLFAHDAPPIVLPTYYYVDDYMDTLNFAQWSPDSRYVLFSNRLEQKMYLYDTQTGTLSDVKLSDGIPPSDHQWEWVQCGSGVSPLLYKDSQ
jgi:hypothetical protein